MPTDELQLTDYAVIRATRHAWDDAVEPAGWDDPVPIGPDVLLGRIPASDADEFVKACMATGPHFDPTPQSPILDTFIRRNAPEGASTWQWDADEAIQCCLALSRLVRDNSHCLEYAVRTVEGWDAGHRQVAPLDIEVRRFAYRVITGERDYLDAQDAEELDALVRRYGETAASLPGRVEHAFWLAEYMTQSPFLLIAFIHVVAALESLLNTSTERASTQFVKRARALAAELEIDGMSGVAANKIYELRSHAVHGVRVDWEAGGTESELLLLAQQVLRTAVRYCIEDPVFAQRFASDKAVESAWPI